MYNHYITWTIDAGLLRIALRIYFISNLALLGIFGRQCCKLAAKVDLLRGSTVSINRMTGWLQARDVLVVIWKLRQLPGGLWLGFMMIISSILTFSTDLAVTGLVKPILLPDLCRFTGGLVIDWNQDEQFAVPPSNGYPAILASNAQIYSDGFNANLPPQYKCLVGIYRKLQQYGDPNFCANEQDVLGTWLCTDLNQDYTFSTNESTGDIMNWLYQHGLQYYPEASSTSYENDLNSSEHLAIWSSSALDDNNLQSFDVKVSVDLSPLETDDKIMKTYYCNITGDVEKISAILAQMQSLTALDQWAPGLEGILYLGADSEISDSAKPSLERYLNSMTMVQGGSNSVFTNNTIDNDPYFYGCMLDKAIINPTIVALGIFTGLILFITISYWLFLLGTVGKYAVSKRTRRDGSRKNIKPVPDSTLSWILQAARENLLVGSGQSGYIQEIGMLGIPTSERELTGWSFSITDSVNGIARLTRRQENIASFMQEGK
jgi:hypothetical protein